MRRGTKNEALRESDHTCDVEVENGERAVGRNANCVN